MIACLTKTALEFWHVVCFNNGTVNFAEALSPKHFREGHESVQNTPVTQIPSDL